jgi:hypothetical protein
MASATAAVRGKKRPALAPAEVAPGPAPEPLLVDIHGLAVMLGRCDKTLRKELRRDRLPPPTFRYGTGKMAWSKQEILAWVACGCPPMSRWRPAGGGHA